MLGRPRESDVDSGQAEDKRREPVHPLSFVGDKLIITVETTNSGEGKLVPEYRLTQNVIVNFMAILN